MDKYYKQIDSERTREKDIFFMKKGLIALVILRKIRKSLKE